MCLIRSEPPSRKRKQQKQEGRQKRAAKLRKVSVDTDDVSSTESSEQRTESEDLEDSESDEEEEKVKHSGKKGSKSRVRASDNERNSVQEETEDDSVSTNKDNELEDPYPHPVLRTDSLYHVACCVDVPEDEPPEQVEEKPVTTGDKGELQCLHIMPWVFIFDAPYWQCGKRQVFSLTSRHR